MNQTTLALRNFSRNTLAEARRAELRGQRTYAALLRASVGEVIEEHRSAVSAPLVDLETEKRLAQTRAFAATISAGYGRTH
jgi:hypothetical protein